MRRRIEIYICLGFVCYLTNKAVKISFAGSIEEYNKIFLFASVLLILLAAILSLYKSDRLFRIVLYPLTLFAGGILGHLETCFARGFNLDYVWEAIPFTLIVTLWGGAILFMFNPHEKIAKLQIVLGVILFILTYLCLSLELMKSQGHGAGWTGSDDISRTIRKEAMYFQYLHRKQQQELLVAVIEVVLVTGGWWVCQRVRHRKHHDLL